ncbi:Membrane-bound lytic murein transglycosylase B precursor (EC [Olavius algarvensis Delta 1 endosymbiont]|nr:Membrane-bound lytic murein transglycosylase B precursor (EC [Olavius algarvensis Delta 1 endosymbiont]
MEYLKSISNYYPIPSTEYRIPNTEYPIPNTQYLLPNPEYPIPNTYYPIPNTQYPIPNTQYPKDGFGSTVAAGLNSGATRSWVYFRLKFPKFKPIYIYPEK